MRSAWRGVKAGLVFTRVPLYTQPSCSGLFPIEHQPKELFVSSFEIKGKVAPCTLFRPLTTDLAVLGRDVTDRLGQTPEFFRNMAIIVDFSALGQMRDGFDLNGLVRLLREQGMTPVGIQGGNEYHERLASKLYLGVFSENKSAPAKVAPSVQPAPVVDHEAMLVDKPVRSGQQVYAKGRDLIVLAPVGPGAEVIADGNVHVYSTLRGRALAGVMGNEDARIFCKELKAELVSVAGLYRVSEDLPANVQNSPVQIRLAGRQLLIEPL
jgi:septum site-determining protein MinC